MSDMIVSDNALPAEYAALQSYADAGWAANSRRDRTEKRLNSSMTKIQEFYDAVMPQLASILDYLESYPLKEMPGQQQNLLNLIYSVADVRNSVESFGEVAPDDCWDTRRLIIRDPFIAT